jgi:hypothetical protein
MFSLLLAVTLAQINTTPVVVELFDSSDCRRCEERLASVRVPGIEVIALVQEGSGRRGLIIDGRVELSDPDQLAGEVITSAERGGRPDLHLRFERSGLTLTAQVEGVKARRTELFLVEDGVVRQRKVGGPCDGEGRSCALASSTTRRFAHFELDPRWNVAHLSVVAVARESDEGPVISSARRAL